MFRLCSSLTQLDLSNFNTSSVTDMGYMFYMFKTLTQVNEISITISFLSNFQIVLLDEPSIGMDHGSRKFMSSIINIISTKRQKSIVIIIIVNGRFVCLWKINQIKAKIRYGYEDNVKKILSEKNIDNVLIKIGSNGFIKEFKN